MGGGHHPNYRRIYVALLILLVISVAGPFIGIAWVTLITAFGIAVVKATMVVQNFMHLKWERRIVKWVLAASLALMALFWAGVAPDVMRHRGHNWVNDAALAATARGIPAPHGEAESAGAEHASASGAGEPAAAPAAAPAFDAHGAFSTMCVTCHGSGGRGDGPGAATLDPKPANFTDPAFWRGKADAELVKAIREGGASVGRSAAMPAWGSLYSEAQAQALVAYLKTLRR
jgi:caa(3)-type oxidase subunit IV